MDFGGKGCENDTDQFFHYFTMPFQLHMLNSIKQNMNMAVQGKYISVLKKMVITYL
jgi:hypothetical protein